MKEFMLLIRNEKDGKKSLTENGRLLFIKSCEGYIEKLKSKHKLIAAQPMNQGGIALRKGDEWRREDIQVQKETLVGYYHIMAENMEEAMAIAMENPEFEYVPSASIEGRAIKIKELETGYQYPNAL